MFVMLCGLLVNAGDCVPDGFWLVLELGTVFGSIGLFKIEN